jgi:predicted glycogen debranching enzyme
MTISAHQCQSYDFASRKEWILTNGIGGYAMGTVSGANTRRYHGHLVAVIRPPTERMVLLANVEAYIQGDGNPIGISTNQYTGAIHPDGFQYLQGFSVGRTAVWHYRAGGMEIRKTLALYEGLNACLLSYENVGDRPLGLVLRPFVSHKPYHENFRQDEDYPHDLVYGSEQTVIEHGGVALALHHAGAQRVPSPGWYFRFEHLRDSERGLDPRDDLFCPCELRYELAPGQRVDLIGSSEADPIPPYREEEEFASSQLIDQLKDATRHFVVRGNGRSTIIAGYPWFTDWGRDTMISIPGICLHTGREQVAREIIEAYAGQMRQGLIPNRFVEHGEPEYNTVDATLWFANAMHATSERLNDPSFDAFCLRTLQEVYRWHMEGTFYGIRVDPRDGLLTQGADGVQLTWMDAKVGDWVVTPRHGKPVEVNALWVNFLRILENLARKLGEPYQEYAASAAQAETSFDAKFWVESLGHYLDTAEPDDASLRPNQVIAMSLPFGPAKGERAARALEVVRRELETPCGLRTLGPGEPGYHGRFRGSLAELDAAYHQGSVWPWLLGPYATAVALVLGDVPEAKRLLKHAKDLIMDYGIGGIAEIYDGDEPREAGGCPWQAWSIAEIVRAWCELPSGEK